MGQIDKYQYTLLITKKSLSILNKYVQLGLAQTFERWKQICIRSVIFELRRKAVKTLLKFSHNQLQLYFERWKTYRIETNLVEQKDMSLKITKLLSTLEAMQKNWVRLAFEEFKKKRYLFRIAKNIVLTMSYCEDMKKSQAFNTWKQLTLDKKLKMTAHQRNIQTLIKVLDTNKKMKIQSFIYDLRIKGLIGKYNHEKIALLIFNALKNQEKDAFRIWHLQTEVSKNISKSSSVHSLFQVLISNLNRQTAPFLAKESVNKKYLVLNKMFDAYKAKLNLSFIHWKSISKHTKETTIHLREKNGMALYLCLKKIQEQNVKLSFSNIKEHARDITMRRLIVAAQILASAQKRYSTAFETWKLFIHYQKVETMKSAAQTLFSTIQEQLRGMTSLVYKNNLENKIKAQALR
jgi:hypothetical protein